MAGTNWGKVVVGSGIFLAGFATPGVPDLEIVGAIIIADGLGVRL